MEGNTFDKNKHEFFDKLLKMLVDVINEKARAEWR